MLFFTMMQSCLHRDKVTPVHPPYIFSLFWQSIAITHSNRWKDEKTKRPTFPAVASHMFERLRNHIHFVSENGACARPKDFSRRRKEERVARVGSSRRGRGQDETVKEMNKKKMAEAETRSWRGGGTKHESEKVWAAFTRRWFTGVLGR